MDVKHFEVVKRRSHADKQWSPDEIRVWQLQYTLYKPKTLDLKRQITLYTWMLLEYVSLA